MRWKPVTISLCFIALAFLTTEFCKKKTAGFCVWKVQNNFDLCAEQAKGSTVPKEVQSLLQQPYKYLGRGKQSFVFGSQDGKYVLKLFNNRYQKRVNYFSALAHLPLIGGYAQKKVEYNRSKLHQTFLSYLLAIDKLKEETGLIYLHTNASEKTSVPLHIIDKLGIHHTLSSNSSAFLIQKRAEPFYPSLLSLKNKGDTQTASKLLDSLFDLLIARYKKGIFDNDPLLRTNFGFIENKAVEIDVGPFSEKPAMQNPEIYSKEIFRITKSLRHWLEENYEELLPELENQYRFKLQSASS